MGGKPRGHAPAPAALDASYPGRGVAMETNGETAVDVQGLRKDYGNFTALQNVSFTVRRGEVYGLIGPNGAGKTTTLRVLATLLQVTGGRVRIFGVDVAAHPADVRKVISYLPEEAGAYK